jgi:hypothetical protein
MVVGDEGREGSFLVQISDEMKMTTGCGEL